MIRSTKFDEALRVRVAKFVIPIFSSVHQVCIRAILSDLRLDGRLWCVIKFRQGWLQIYNAVMNLFLNSTPGLINLISAVLWPATLSRAKQKTTRKKLC